MSQASPEALARIADIDAALARGESAAARRNAELLRQESTSRSDLTTTGLADLRLSYCDLQQSHVTRARDGARQVAKSFRELGALSEEVNALSLWSRTASILGRSVEAVESALLAINLAQALPRGRWTASASLSLGVAYGWAHAFTRAMQAFDTVKQIVEGEEQGDSAALLEVEVERHWVQAVRFETERMAGKPTSSFDAPKQLRQLQEGLATPAPTRALTPGAESSLSDSVTLVCGLKSLWSGDVEQARDMLSACASTHESAHGAGWLISAQSWLHAELAMQQGELEAAAMHASRMTALAHEQEHQLLACLGHRLTSDIYIRLGQPQHALAELHQLLERQRAIQGSHLDSREEVARYRAEMRESELRIQALAAESNKFKQWAHEDALTGLGNLRLFNQCLHDWHAASADSGQPLCVALIDVDKFKLINDTYSYDTGDRVLRGIAEQMKAHVREKDLPVRWGGDEFAILFRETGETAALQVAQRIQQSVAQHDWTSLAPGLKVAISVGVTEARAGDNKVSLVRRSEEVMFAQKQANHRAEAARSVSPNLMRMVSGWLRASHRVVIFVGAGMSGQGQMDAEVDTEQLAAGTSGAGASFRHVDGLRSDPDGFTRYWREWRRSKLDRAPSAVHRALVTLSHHLPQPTFVSERIDGLLTMAGALKVVEIYGNALNDRCAACERKVLNVMNGRCMICDLPGNIVRPDVVLLGEQPDHRLLAAAELAAKRAGVILVVDSDATTYPSSALLEKARSRGAKVVMLGHGQATRRGVADITVPTAPELALRVLIEQLSNGAGDGSAPSELSADGLQALCFLTGHAEDNLGTTLQQALGWKHWEIERHLGTLPWIFPLPTRSTMNPAAPMPTRADFKQLAADEHVRKSMREAFLMMLRFYGFEWRDGSVEKALDWRRGFASWAVSHSHHDLFISRILRAMALTGLKADAEAWLRALDCEVLQYRGNKGKVPLSHWRLAVLA